jgi:hypothetical protein
LNAKPISSWPDRSNKCPEVTIKSNPCRWAASDAAERDHLEDAREAGTDEGTPLTRRFRPATNSHAVSTYPDSKKGLGPIGPLHVPTVRVPAIAEIVAVRSGPRHRLQALECQALGVLDAGKIEPPNEGDDGVAIAIGQRNHGINGNTLGVHGAFLAVSSLTPRSLTIAG